MVLARRSRCCAEAYSSMPHKQHCRLTQPGLKSILSGQKLKKPPPHQGAKAIFALPPFSSAAADLVYPFTRETAPAGCTGAFSPKRLQGEFAAPSHRFAPATGSLEKRSSATTPLHSLSKLFPLILVKALTAVKHLCRSFPSAPCAEPFQAGGDADRS